MVRVWRQALRLAKGPAHAGDFVGQETRALLAFRPEIPPDIPPRSRDCRTTESGDNARPLLSPKTSGQISLHDTHDALPFWRMISDQWTVTTSSRQRVRF